IIPSVYAHLVVVILMGPFLPQGERTHAIEIGGIVAFCKLFYAGAEIRICFTCKMSVKEFGDRHIGLKLVQSVDHFIPLVAKPIGIAVGGSPVSAVHPPRERTRLRSAVLKNLLGKRLLTMDELSTGFCRNREFPFDGTNPAAYPVARLKYDYMVMSCKN